MDSSSALWMVAPPFVMAGIFSLPLLAFANGVAATCAPALPREGDCRSALWMAAPPYVGVGTFSTPSLAFADGVAATCALALPREVECRFCCLLLPGSALAAVHFGHSMRFPTDVARQRPSDWPKFV